MENPIYKQGDTVYTFFNEKGTSCKREKDEEHNKKRIGKIQKINFDKHRKVFVLNVKTETRFFLCEQTDVNLN